jgi:uncharacterized protein (TIGR03435 family)
MGNTTSILKCLIVGAAMSGLLLAVPNAAHQVATTPVQTFDVLSIKAAPPPKREVGCRYLNDRVLCQLPLRSLVEDAYDVEDYTVDVPKWMSGDQHVFALEGIMPPGTTEETARLMLQHGLAERFALKVHWEQRDIAAYAMVAGKGGVKLQPAPDAGHRQLKAIPIAGAPAGKYTMFMAPGEFFCAATSLDMMADNLRSLTGLDRPVVNMTGLTGEYAFDVHWTPPDKPEAGAPYGDAATILSAIEKQLGLRLEKRTLSLKVLVVDHADAAPTPN